MRRTMSFAASSTGSAERRGSVSHKRKYVKLHSKGLKRGTHGLGKVFLAQTLDTNAPVVERSPPAPPPPIHTDGAVTASPTSLTFGDAATSVPVPSTPTKSQQSNKTSSPVKRSSSLLRPIRMNRTNSNDTATSSLPDTPTTPTRKSTASSPASSPMAPKHKSSTSSSSSTTGAGVKGKGKALWCLAWSNDGRYLATAGQDAVVRIYRTLSSEIKRDEGSSASPPTGGGPSSANVCEETPYRVWQGHKDGVLSLSWSKNGFLLTSSMDKVSGEDIAQSTTRIS
jgi:WD40 repeat protein